MFAESIRRFCVPKWVQLASRGGQDIGMHRKAQRPDPAPTLLQSALFKYR